MSTSPKILLLSIERWPLEPNSKQSHLWGLKSRYIKTPFSKNPATAAVFSVLGLLPCNATFNMQMVLLSFTPKSFWIVCQNSLSVAVLAKRLLNEGSVTNLQKSFIATKPIERQIKINRPQISAHTNTVLWQALKSAQKPRNTLLPSFSAPARPRITVTGLAAFVQNWCSGGKKASLLFSNCQRLKSRFMWLEKIKAWGVIVQE